MINGTKETEVNASSEKSVNEQTKPDTSAENSANEINQSTETTETSAASTETKSAPDAAVSGETQTEPTADNSAVPDETKSADSGKKTETAKNVSASADKTDQPPNASAEMESGDLDDSDDQQNEIDFGAILDEFEQDQTEFFNGMLVEGKVIKISDHGVMVDFGYKSEGMVPIDEFTSPEGEVTVQKGDTVEVVIKNIYIGDGPPELSKDDALSRKSWDEIEQAYNSDENITGTVSSKTKGGLKVDINGVEAFLPGSQIDSRPVRNLDGYIGKEIEAKVIKFSRKRNNIVISRKALTDEVMNKLKEETLSKIEENHVVEGVVKNLTEYGAFVDIGGIDGLLHVTDMSWGRLQNPNQQFKVNDEIQVKILKLDREKEKVSLGYKQLLPDPWSSVVEIYPVDTKVKGTVSSLTDYGAFVELEPGVEGLVHVSEMSWSKRNISPKKFLKSNEEIEVQILGIDTEERRISLGMKQLQENPWDTIAIRYPVGTRINGKVRNLTDFGAFVEVEPGVDGLVHVSDISHKNIKHPKDVLKRDQEVEAVITNVNTGEQRLSLSMKELTPSTWDNFVASHTAGDVIKGEVSRFAGFGVFVKLAEDLEGLCHISELSDERVEKPEDVVSIGQELDFKILRIELDTEKIGLSHKAVGKDDEVTEVDSRSYSTEAKGGMASLGELANLQFGQTESTQEETQDEQPKKSKKERRAEKARLKAEAQAFAETAPDETVEARSEDSDENAEAVEDTKEDASETQEASKADTETTKSENTESEKTENVDDKSEESATENVEEAENKTETADQETAADEDKNEAEEVKTKTETAENDKSEDSADISEDNENSASDSENDDSEKETPTAQAEESDSETKSETEKEDESS